MDHAGKSRLPEKLPQTAVVQRVGQAGYLSVENHPGAQWGPGTRISFLMDAGVAQASQC